VLVALALIENGYGEPLDVVTFIRKYRWVKLDARTLPLWLSLVIPWAEISCVVSGGGRSTRSS
jgi:hypothetical protein